MASAGRAHSLRTVSVVTTAEAEEAVAQLLEKLFSQPASSFTDADTGRVTVSVYLEHWKPKAKSLGDKIVKGLAEIKRCGLKVAPAKVNFAKLKRQDWADSWKRHFKPLAIGSALLIKPSWSRRRPRKGQAVVILDPGLSFGTGQHPTTAFCLAQLATRQKVDTKSSFLDIGTGSGILAIAAAKLGYGPILAFDLDPEAVRIATANARKNRVGHKMEIRQADLMKLLARGATAYDLICANLISTVLISQRNRIVARLKPGGRLVVAGITKDEFSQVQKAFERAGLGLLASRTEDQWRSGAFGWAK